MADQQTHERITRQVALDKAVEHAGNVAPHRGQLPGGDEIVTNAEKFYRFLTGQEPAAEEVATDE
ncbi:hypothetical protein SEA_WIDOW_52 [Gordonia phage Widow]|nr:hypothetical protein SEA_WIDOW_52 [Gordonia phage Widow]